MNTSETLGHYKLLHLVHQGYLGSLWAARGISGEANDLPALVRRIELPGGLSEEQGAQITEAAWDSLELSHPHLLNVAEVVFANGAFALAHDYVEAEVLQALLLMSTVKKALISPQIIARILLDVVEGLTAVDTGAAGLGANPFHGGVTPESILVGGDGNARLIDSMIGGAISANTLLRLNAGRVGYCSPEQLRGEPTSERTDVFALAVMAAELLAGRRLFLGAANVIEKKIVEGNLPQINGWLKPGHGIEGKLLDLLDRAIVADPKKRIPTPRALVDDFCALLPQPASRAEVGALVTALASKQLEVRARKLGSHAGPLLSQKVGDARAPRSSSRAAIAAIVAAPAKPPMAATMQQFVAPKVVPPMPPAVVAKAAAQQTKSTGPDSAVGVDELLSGVSEVVKREDMQSGTHRKVMSTLIGVAPPPQPVIGKPPPVTVPTAVIMSDAPGTSSRGTAGIADLIGTAVPSTRDVVAPVISPPVSKSREEPLAAVEPRKTTAALEPSPADPRLTALSEEVRRYRRLTILFGSTSVLLLTLLCWLVIGGLGSSNTEPLQNAPQPVAVHRSPSVAAAPVAAPPPSGPAPSTPSASASAAAASAGGSTANLQSTTGAAKAAHAPQKKQAKKFVPDGI